jgi:type IV secretory pathway VirB2 component (pilin)
MKEAFHRPAFIPLIVSMTAALLLQGRLCLAATNASVLPWDQTLTALQDVLLGPVAHAAIVLNFACSAILYALGSRQFAGRLLAGGFASCLALIAVRFLSYVFPF